MSTDPLEPGLCDLSGPFRGSSAVAAGLVTPKMLRGHRFQRLFPDVYAPAELDRDLALRARAAGVLVAGRGAVAGYAAAELLGASCGAADAPVDVLMPGRYRCEGLLVHRDRFDPAETVAMRRGGVMTTPSRTAYDLARWASSLTERVVAVDALAHCCRVGPDDVRRLWREYLGAHGGPLLPEVLELVDPRAESPMESRARVALVLGGLTPEVQYPVVLNGRRYRLDLAYPRHRLAVEYDGAAHRLQAQARRDLVREADLTAAGWRVLRFDAHVVMTQPGRIVAEVQAELAARSVR
jgi:very-short-patch-repair endonuclease